MTRGRHIPIRTCMGCGSRDAQKAMARFVSTSEGGLRLDPERVANGRGAYLHLSRECQKRFAKRKGQVRSLRVSISAAARGALTAELQQQISSE